MSSTDAKQPEASQALVDDKPADADDDDLNDALFGDDEDDAQVEAGTEGMTSRPWRMLATLHLCTSLVTSVTVTGSRQVGAAPLAKDDEDPVAASLFQHSSLHEPAEAEDRLREEIAKRNQ